MEVDAIGIKVSVPTEWRPNADDRRSWFFQLVERDDQVDPELTHFERQKLGSALLVAMSRRILDPVEEEFADELIYSLEDLGFLALAPLTRKCRKMSSGEMGQLGEVSTSAGDAGTKFRSSARG